MPSLAFDSCANTYTYSDTTSGYTYTYPMTATYNDSIPLPVVAYPVAALPSPLEGKKNDSPLAWLRREVDEICELAFAA